MKVSWALEEPQGKSEKRGSVLEWRGWGCRGQEAELPPLEGAGSLGGNLGLNMWSSD